MTHNFLWYLHFSRYFWAKKRNFLLIGVTSLPYEYDGLYKIDRDGQKVAKNPMKLGSEASWTPTHGFTAKEKEGKALGIEE